MDGPSHFKQENLQDRLTGLSLKMGRTMLLATVVSAKEARENVDFMPLSVEYKEKFASIGRFPGGFMKREARPGDNEILNQQACGPCPASLFPGRLSCRNICNHRPYLGR
jgi:hypothetical protein